VSGWVLSSGNPRLGPCENTYLPNSPLVSQILFTNNGVRRMVTTKQYDNLNRLMQISNTGGTGSTLPSFTYTYNDANQRVRVTLADGSY